MSLLEKSREMILKLLLQTIVLLLSIVKARGRGQAVIYSFAKPGCQEKCGNVTIPFPFGIGPNDCFLDQWYEITCQNGTSSAPRLKKLDLQVLDIHLPFEPAASDGVMTVSFPIVYSKSCSRNHTRTPVLLEETSFMIAQQENTFLAVGCDDEALVENNQSEVVGCVLSEGKKSVNTCPVWSSSNGVCSSPGCCQTLTPYGLRSFDVSFRADKDDSDTAKGCTYAALVKLDAVSTLRIHDLGFIGYVPAVLQWGVSNDSHLGIDLQDYNVQFSNAYMCTHLSMSGNVMPFMQCHCVTGYAGNPYLVNGCRDINECEDADRPRICPGMTCVNRPGGYHCVDDRRTIRLVMIGSVTALGTLLFLALLWLLHKYIDRRRQKNRKEKFFKRNGGLILQQQLSSSPKPNAWNGKLFDFKELEKATENFSKDRELGRGGQGTVFKGMLTDGRIVAVKRSMEIAEDFVEQFINEVVILSQINHRNVVKLLGCCLETEVPLLVYEFIPNGTLYKYLHEPTEDFRVPWDVRLRIACEVAGALSYLHSAASMPIYHRDIKTSNILLDEMFRAKVADFGTSRSVCPDKTHITTLVKGTFGYLDPEYFQSSRFTDKSDVYSFGVVLVELLTGKKAVSSSREDEGGSLVMYFINSMMQNCLFEIVDAQLLKEANKEKVVAIASLAKRCLYLHGRNRPAMKEVSMELEGIRNPQQSQHVKTADDWSDYYFGGEAIPDDGTSLSSEEPEKVQRPVAPLVICS